MLIHVHQSFPGHVLGAVWRIKFDRLTLMVYFEVSKKDPALQPPGEAAMVIYSHAHHDPREPYPQRTITPEMFNTAEASHKCFLDNIFRINRIPG